jgi:hypothetical protein
VLDVASCAKKGSFQPSINLSVDHEPGLAEPKQTQNRRKENPRHFNPAALQPSGTSTQRHFEPAEIPARGGIATPSQAFSSSAREKIFYPETKIFVLLKRRKPRA